MKTTIKLYNLDVREKIASILLVLYLFLAYYYLNIKTEHKSFFLLGMVCVSIMSLIYAIFRFKKSQINPVTFQFWTVLILGYLILQFLNNKLTFGFLIIISNLCIAYFIFSSNFNLRILYIIFLAISYILFVKAINGGHVKELFVGASSNWVSAVMLANTSVIYFIEWRQKKQVSIWISCVTFLVSVVAIGRGGIISTGILFFGLILLRSFQWIKKRNYIIIFLIFSIVALLIFGISFFTWIKNLPQFERLTHMGFDSSERVSMIKNYFSHLNLKNILLGYNYNNDPFFLSWDLNPHNSLILLHFNTGFFSFIVMLVLIALIIRFYKYSKILFLVIIALIFRGLTDAIFFLGRYDFIFLVLLLYAKSQNYYLFNNKRFVLNIIKPKKKVSEENAF